ncbi:hypothetical protein BH18ACT1_BH18ACT1_01500 [soil metagenome]
MASDPEPTAAPDMSDLTGLLATAQRLQEQLLAARAEAEAQVVEGHSGGGAVRIALTGGLEPRSVTIDPAAVDPGDVPLLEDLVLAALTDALARAQEAQAAAMPSLDLPGLPGLPGLTPPTAPPG